MSNDINLVSPGVGKSSKEARRLSTFSLIATTLIVGVGFVSVLLFVLNHILSPSAVIKEQKKIAANITLAKQKQVKLVVLGRRLNDISNLISKRSNYEEALSSILSETPAGMSVASLTLDKQKLSMVVSAGSLISTNSFIDSLKGMVEEKKFLKNVTINNLILNSRTSSYTLTLEIELL